MRTAFLFYFLWRTVDFFVIWLTPRFIPYLGFFPYKEFLNQFNLPEIFTKLANFDGVHYLMIAQNGYQQYQQAFFPFYPLLIRWFTPLFFNNSLLAAFFIGNLSFLLGLYFFSRYLVLLKINKKTIYWVLLILLVFPTSFFFGAIYTEGLFFLLVILSLYFLEKNQPGHYFLAGVFAFFASLTRLMGVFLFLPFFFHLIKKRADKNYLLLIFPFFGFFLFSFYLWQTTGDPLFFFHSQPAFGANRSTEIVLLPQVYWRYFKILFQADFNWQYFISLSELIIFTFVFIILILDLLKQFKVKQSKNYYSILVLNYKLRILDPARLSLNLFSLINLLLPTFTGTFSSIPRYALLSLSFFVFLSSINRKKLLFFLFLIFFIFHLIFLGFFSQGYFVS